MDFAMDFAMDSLAFGSLRAACGDYELENAANAGSVAPRVNRSSEIRWNQRRGNPRGERTRLLGWES
jgi:hypothetical protein